MTMAMASMSMALNRPLAPLQVQQPSLRSRRSRGPARTICCSSSSPSPKRNQECAASEGLGTRFGGMLVPVITAAALVSGSAPNLVEAVFGPPPAIAAEVETTNLDAYKDLLQKIKERRGRQGFQAPAPAPAPAPVPTPAPAQAQAPSASLLPQLPDFSAAAARIKEAAQKALLDRGAEETRANANREAERREAEKREAERREAENREAERQAEARRAQESAAIAQRERAAFEKAARQNESVANVTKTHGFLPLFVSQFFLLLAALGVAAVLFVVPEKQLKEIQDKVDAFVDKAVPVAEDAYSKAKPYAEKAWVKAQEAGVVAKPYVEKAWEQAKPLAAKAVEASKPLLKEAQVKANEFLQEAQKKVK